MKRSAAAWAMSVPTTYFAANGKAKSIARAKSVPLPTDVSPTMKPPTSPIDTATIRSRFVRRLSALGGELLCSSALATNEIAPIRSVKPSTRPCTESTLSP